MAYIGQAPTGPTVESSVVYPGDIAPGCIDPCAPCAQGTSLYDPILCGEGGGGLIADWLTAHQGLVIGGAATLALLAFMGGGRRR